ncbi:MAG: DUF1289 domain-containing protein [Pseudogulbenkiania sp.]|nr:DUF1289 domain-containing protein [Pseudogulbenkiania sp.]
MSEPADSPCIAHCSTALGDNVCRGCFRTFMEVAQWGSLAPADKRQIWERLPPRRRLGEWAGLLGGALDLVTLDDQEWATIWFDGFARLLFRFEADGSLRLSLPDNGLVTVLGLDDETRLLSQAKRWLTDSQPVIGKYLPPHVE